MRDPGVRGPDNPEEYVRQSIARELLGRYGYRREHLACEVAVKMGSETKRADIGVFLVGSARQTQDEVYIVIECKRADVSASAFDEAIAQLKSYMAACRNCHFGMAVAGPKRACFREIKHADGRWEVFSVPDLPPAADPRARFTNLGIPAFAVPPQPVAQQPNAETQASPAAPDAPAPTGRKRRRKLVLGGVALVAVLATVVLGSTGAHLMTPTATASANPDLLANDGTESSSSSVACGGRRGCGPG